MAERLFQGHLFDEQPSDVTPKDFTYLPEVGRPASADLSQATALGRFIREASQPTHIISPKLAADYLITQIFSPFAEFDQAQLADDHQRETGIQNATIHHLLGAGL